MFFQTFFDMKPKKIILIRHGESEGNINNEIYALKPDYALLLTEKGKIQSYAAGQKLKDLIQDETVMFYISPFWRTRMTFEQIMLHFDKERIAYREEPRIREQEWGHLRTVEEIKKMEKERDAYGTFYYRIPNGESGADLYDRLSDFMDTLHRDFDKKNYPENTVLITHGMTIRLFLMRWFHWTVEHFETIANPKNCDLIEMQLQDDGKRYELVTEMTIHSVYHPFQYKSEYL